MSVLVDAGRVVIAEDARGRVRDSIRASTVDVPEGRLVSVTVDRLRDDSVFTSNSQVKPAAWRGSTILLRNPRRAVKADWCWRYVRIGRRIAYVNLGCLRSVSGGGSCERRRRFWR